MRKTLTLEYWMDDGWFIGRLKEIPSVFSQGETIEELEENIRDAYEMVLETEPTINRSDARLRKLRSRIEKTCPFCRVLQRTASFSTLIEINRVDV